MSNLYVKWLSCIFFAFYPATSRSSLTEQAEAERSPTVEILKKINVSTLSRVSSVAEDTLKKCASDALLSAEAGHDNYIWNTGQTTQSITVTNTGEYWWETINYQQNRVVNSGFEMSNHYNGFSSDYTKNSSSLMNEGSYAIVTNPRSVHSNFSAFGDHTTGTGYMMVVNGASVPGKIVWKEDISVNPGETYVFSIWCTSVNPDNPGKLRFSINGVELGDIQLASATGSWQNYATRWDSGQSTTATIAIVNQNTVASGNDFAIDDIVFAPVVRKSYMVYLYPVPPRPYITTL